MAYSIDSVFKAAKETQAKQSQQRSGEAVSPTLRLWRPPSFDPQSESFTPAQPADLAKAKAVAPAVVQPQGPSPEEIEAIRAEAYKLGVDAGYEAGHAEGNKEGFMAGHEEGLKRGHEAGYQASFAQSQEEINKLTQSLESLVNALRSFPSEVADQLAELAFSVGERLSAKEGMDKGPFVNAIQEALTHFPKPGETLFFRVRSHDAEVWKKLTQEANLPFSTSLIVDDNIPQGHAYVEIHGTRLDLGYSARRAIVRAALGLDPNADERSP